MTVVAYIPAMNGGFVWDDDSYVTENPTLRTLDGLGRIWFEIGAVPQYYPLVHTTFWAEYHLWQLQPLGYHIVNVLLHGLTAVLLWLVLTRLSVPAAWLAAAIFALHPVHVESVAWITERKNVLSGFFYFAAILAYIHFLRLDPEPSQESTISTSVPLESGFDGNQWRFYFLAAVLYLCALLSKSVTSSMPVVILLLLWWKRDRIRWRDALPLVPFFLLGIALGMLTIWLEKHHVGAKGEEWALSIVDRFFVAGRALWFYAAKLILPYKLTFNYPQWQIDTGVWWQYLFPLATLTTLAVLWLLRKRIGKAVLVAVLFFVVTLVPALGFFDVYPMRYSFVADHFQYLASVGLIVLLASMLVNLRRFLPKRSETVLGALVLLVLGLLTWRQGYIYQDTETLWLDTINKNPSSWMAHNNLGDELTRQGRLDEAVSHFYLSLSIKPDHYRAHYNLANTLSRQGNFDKAIDHYQKALRINPYHVKIQNNLGIALIQQGKVQEAADRFSTALEIKPDFAPAHLNLGLALYQQGRIDEAISHYSEALKINPEFADAHNALGAALGSQGKLREAKEHFSAALRIDPNLEEARKNLEVVSKLMRQKDSQPADSP